jgi:Peptidase M76 family
MSASADNSNNNGNNNNNSKKIDDDSNTDHNKTVTTSTTSTTFLASSSSASPPVNSSNDVSSSASCRSCVDLLREILNRSESRPRSLLQSLFAPSDNSTSTSTGAGSSTTTGTTSSSHNDGMLQWRDTQHGVQVLIPTEAASRRRGIPILPPHRRRWSRFDSDENQPENSIKIIEKDEAEEDDRHSTVIAAERESVDNKNNPSFVVLQATSASATSSTVAVNPSSSSTREPDEPETEWLQVSCKKCSDTGPEAGARAYIMGPTPLSMVVCTNRLLSSPSDDDENLAKQQVASSLLFSKTTSKLVAESQDQQNQQKSQRDEQLREMEEILTHELVHVYDVRKLQLDLRDCENLAYSEVRAAREAECQRLGASVAASLASSGSIGTGGGLWRSSSSSPLYNNPHEACVRTKALTATHNLFPSRGQTCLQRVFDKAMKDKRPFVVGK